MSGKFALIIANTEYADPGLAKLTAPGKDAEEFARVLKSPEIAAFDDVHVLVNENATTARELIDEFFARKTPDDLLVLYFSGHGVRDEFGSLYLAVKNTNRDRLRSTAINSSFVREGMDQSRSKRQVLILDCCNSGAFAQGTKAEIGGSVGIASAFEGTGYGRVVLTASDSTQFAWEGDKVIGETTNSLFTHFLVKGLEGEADRDGDGAITVDELYDYAYEQIVSCTPKQTPGKWSYKQQGEIVLRQNLRLEDTRPIPLPEELTEAMKSSLPYIREGVVRQLEVLLVGRNLGLARSARAALEKIAKEDDSRSISQAAAGILERIHKDELITAEKAIKEKAEREAEEKAAKEKAEREAAEEAAREKAEQLKTTEAIRIAREREQFERQHQLKSTAGHPVEGKTVEPKQKRQPGIKKILSIGGIIALLFLCSIAGKGAWSFIFPPVTQTAILSHTPTSRTGATATPTSTPTNTASVTPAIPQDPREFIYFYFDNINNRNYDLTWSLLSNQYKAKTNPDGIEQYKKFWDSYTVKVTSVSYELVTDTAVKVSLKTVFYKANASTNENLTYYLTSDNPQGSWLFDIAPATVGSASDTTCSTVPRRLSIGIQAEVVTETDPLLLRSSPAEGVTVFERMPPGTIVTVTDGPICGLYRSVYFWWWKVRSPSGKTGWVVEGSDATDPIFIQPTQ